MTFGGLYTRSGFAFSEAKAFEAGVHRTHMERGEMGKDEGEKVGQMSKGHKGREAAEAQDTGGVEAHTWSDGGRKRGRGRALLALLCFSHTLRHQALGSGQKLV